MSINIHRMFEYLFCADESSSFLNLRFENDVKMYGTQTAMKAIRAIAGFENDVKMYGTQTGFEEVKVLETSLDKGTQRKTTENELPSLTQCTA